MAAINKLQSQISSCPSSVSQAAAVAALTGPQDFVAETVAVYQGRRDKLVKLLSDIPGLSCTVPSGGFYVFVNCQAVATDEDFARHLLESQRGRGHPRQRVRRTGLRPGLLRHLERGAGRSLRPHRHRLRRTALKGKHVACQHEVRPPGPVARRAAETIGPMAEPILIGGELVHPGDVIRGDADGVVVVRREDLADTITRCQDRENAEADYIEAYRAGKTPVEVSNLAPVLEAKGLIID